MIKLHMTNGEIVRINGDAVPSINDAMNQMRRASVFWAANNKTFIRVEDISIVQEVDDDED